MNSVLDVVCLTVGMVKEQERSADKVRRWRATGTTKVLEPEPGPPGPIELGVIAECEGLAMAAERPALVAIAKLLAREMDNPQCQGMHVQCHRALMFAMAPLRGKSKPKRLAVVRIMIK